MKASSSPEQKNGAFAREEPAKVSVVRCSLRVSVFMAEVK